jgi:caffeoyl-CoA O-methyltransferase
MTRTHVCAFVLVAGTVLSAQPPRSQAALDAQVTRFLDRNRDGWRDMNVPEADGRALHDLILEKRYTRALEIGTSTGRSAIWMGWALSRTGGRLTTIEIDADRYRQAVRNFADAGLTEVITAKLGDAHALVPRLEGPFDLVFIDADEDWFTRYAAAVVPKLAPGGALAAHDVTQAKWPGMSSPVVVRHRDFFEYMTGLRGFETGFRAGVFVAVRKSGRSQPLVM